MASITRDMACNYQSPVQKALNIQVHFFALWKTAIKFSRKLKLKNNKQHLICHDYKLVITSKLQENTVKSHLKQWYWTTLLKKNNSKITVQNADEQSSFYYGGQLWPLGYKLLFHNEHKNMHGGLSLVYIFQTIWVFELY